MKRTIVKIDRELCNGCGKCVTPCAEGAIALVDGKARVVKEALCDGAGFCLGICPTGALTLEEREAPAFDPGLARREEERRGKRVLAETCHLCGNNEEETPLLPLRSGGRSLWVCVRCLPSLIHG
ncbi:MAG TPA: ferredoxin [bacterium]|nr:ferredoxin [bacterium]HPJ72215.1 ferredoxin [bacterium]HPQ65215.1 ferredoxin [bacterium]